MCDLANVPNAIKRKNAGKKSKSGKDNDEKSICSPDMKRVNPQKARTANQKQNHDCVLIR